MPRNAADDDNGDVKVADFGFAKRISELELQEVPCGTPGRRCQPSNCYLVYLDSVLP